MRPESIAVLGPGLLGGSILYDAIRLGWTDVRAYARRAETCAEMKMLGLAHLATTNLNEAVAGATLIVLATPVGAYAALTAELLRAPLAADVLITDVGSVKGMVVAGVGAQCAAAGHRFIGSHPMAGSEAKGLAASKPHLFTNAACILTPTEDTAPADLTRLQHFWEALGCHVTSMDAERHDQIVAHISHMPHLAAAAVALAGLEADPSIAIFAAGGLRDTTRVASGDPSMWQEILLENRPAVLTAGRELQQHLARLLEALEQADATSLHAALAAAKHLRDQRYGSGGVRPSKFS